MDDWYTNGDAADQQPRFGAMPQYGAGPHSAPSGPSMAGPVGSFAASGAGMYGGSDSFTPPPSGGGYSGAGSYASDPIGLTHGYGIGQPVGAVGGGAYPGAGQFDNEPPLLEELGINFEHIWAKTRAVLVPTRRIESAYLDETDFAWLVIHSDNGFGFGRASCPKYIRPRLLSNFRAVLVPTRRIESAYLDETDLAGPLVFALVFGTCLLLAGKLHFGYIYGFGAFGCGALSLVLNLMGDRPIDAWRTTSVLGYCLLPVVLLSAVGIALDLSGRVGLALAGAAVAWSCTAATKLFEQYLDMRHQRWLIAYPIGLLYCCFVLMAIF